MAPSPQESPHYDGASPLDGGSRPNDLSGNEEKFKLTGLETGLIVALVVLIVASLGWLFFRRARRNNRVIGPLSSTEAVAVVDNETELALIGDRRTPTPGHKEDRASTVDNDFASELERPAPAHTRTHQSQTRPADQAGYAEKHELATGH